MTHVLAGEFDLALNMNLRRTSTGPTARSRSFGCARPAAVHRYAPVQTDKTKESMVEVDRELRGIIGNKPVTADELAKAQANLTLTLPGNWETMAAVKGSLEQMVVFGLDDHYFETLAQRVGGSHDSRRDRGGAGERADPTTWSGSSWATGPRSAGIRELGWGEIRFLDADGKPLGSR
jgi:zinc protease